MVPIICEKSDYDQLHINEVFGIFDKKAQLTQGLRATAPLFQDGRQPPSWILSNRK